MLNCRFLHTDQFLVLVGLLNCFGFTSAVIVKHRENVLVVLWTNFVITDISGMVLSLGERHVGAY